MKIEIDLDNCTEEELDDTLSILVSRLSRTQQEDLLAHLIDTMGIDPPGQPKYVPNHEAAAAQFLAS
jgi:hypothetical protein